MRAASLFSIAWLVLSVSAYASVGAYERMWYWYAYTLDGETGDGAKVAPGCGRANSVSRCSFVQFMNYIAASTAGLTPSDIANVDTTDLDRSVAALVEGGYTGAYKTNLIFAGIQGANAFPQIFQAVGGFCGGNVKKSSDATLKTNLQQGRMLNNVQAFTADMQQLGWTVVTRQIPVFKGSTDTMTDIEPRDTAAASGVSVQQVRDRITIYKETDTTNHQVNIKAASTAAESVSLGCL